MTETPGVADRIANRRKRNGRKCLVFLAVLSAISLVAAGCGSDGDETSGSTTEASSEDPFAGVSGNVVFYSSLVDGLNTAMVEAFEEKYPETSIEVVRLASNQLFARFQAEVEAGAPVADVMISGTSSILDDAFENGWTVAMPSGPAIDAFPSEYRSESWAVTDITPITIMYNSSLVSDADAPRTWEAALDAEWSEQIVLPDPRNADSWLGLFKLLLDEYGEDYLTALAASDPSIVDSAVPGAQAVASGERQLMVPSAASLSPPLIEEGAPVVDLIPEDLATGIEHYVTLSAKASDNRAAQAFINWMLSTEGQEVVSAGLFSPLPDVEGTEPLPDSFVRLPVSEGQADRDRIVQLLGLE